MFETGSLIVYGNSGICRVEGVSMKQQLGGGGQAMYYTLTPLFGSGTVYTPVETKVFMRPVITGEEARDLIRRMPEIEPGCCAGTDQRTLAEHYRGLLHTYQCESLVKIIKAVHLKARQAAARLPISSPRRPAALHRRTFSPGISASRRARSPCASDQRASSS